MLLSKKCSPLNCFANTAKEVSRRTRLFLIETDFCQWPQSKTVENFGIIFANIFTKKMLSLTTFFHLEMYLKKNEKNMDKKDKIIEKEIFHFVCKIHFWQTQ